MKSSKAHLEEGGGERGEDQSEKENKIRRFADNLYTASQEILIQIWTED